MAGRAFEGSASGLGPLLSFVAASGGLEWARAGKASVRARKPAWGVLCATGVILLTFAAS